MKNRLGVIHIGRPGAKRSQLAKCDEETLIYLLLDIYEKSQSVDVKPIGYARLRIHIPAD